MSKVRVLVTLSELERIRLQRRACQEGVSVAAVVRRAVDHYLMREQQHQVGEATT